MKKKAAVFLFVLSMCLSLLGGTRIYAGVVPSGTSASYQSGSYYGNLWSTLNAKANSSQKDRFVAVAMSQKGYNSSANKNDFSGDGAAGKTSSGKTYCEYSRWCGANGADWCASFVSWCAYMAGIPTSIIPKSAGAGTFRSCGTKHIIWSSDFSTYIDYQPKKGDIMLAMPYRLVNGEYAHYNSYEKTAHVAIVAEDATSRASDGGWIFTTIERRGTTVGQRTMSTQIRAGGESAYGTHYVQMFVTPNFVEHNHIWNGGEVTQYPTCVNTGVRTYTCICGDTKTEVIPVLTTHVWNSGSVTLSPTCTTDGIRTYTCIYSSLHTRTETIPKTGHSPAAAVRENVRPASCTAAGSYDEVVYCSVCRAQISRRTVTIPQMAHVWDYGTVTKPATDATKGVRTYTCKVCKTKRTAEIPKLSSADKTVPLTQVPSVKTAEKTILNMKGDEAPGNARFNLLQLKNGEVGKHQIQLKWKKVKGATGYIVYGAKCGQKNKRLKILNSGSRTSWTRKNLKSGTYYKYFVVATAKKGTERRVIATSTMIHVITKGGSTVNYKSIKLKNYRNKAITLKAGSRTTLRAAAVRPSGKKVKNHRAMRFESTNTSIAVVGEKTGRIRAKKKGTCYIYVYAQNGVCQRVKVKVKG